MRKGAGQRLATGAATLYRNYVVPVEGVAGQTRERQIDTLRDVGAALHIGVRPHSGPGQTSRASWPRGPRSCAYTLGRR